ncbi:hypothetical protein Desor_2157 [Desulfosporosinus orientis DSM 765]|uniref:DUF4829 domain-containing protein n=1 Tax=Desulfosporosinus orientis (strain ATCC 19365 / DSM 765 / NCIMB 8382 / VKM B-1628 / Singapore I) TaxID=768706 RepID=G7W8Q1_DESOD|nr:hypothetical protein [Desulfosporosinus orientis]AET67761.1 hypothetical protein Desor_2157 [Desulfosporosinus orientis DSM 765]
MVNLVGKKERIIWISLVTVILVIFVLAMVNLEQEKTAWSQEEANLRGQISELTSETESVTESYTRQKSVFPGNNPNIKYGLEQQGFVGSVQDIVNDLIKHPELIPYEGVLGGKMGFYNKDEIYVLTDQWVCAYFNDGHIGGSLLLSYKINNGAIEWKVIDSRLFN